MNMKKITLVLAGLMVSGMASAVQLTQSGSVSMDDCAPLNENVRINLSNNVHAGVTCNANAVALSACHTGGKVTTRSVPVKTVAAVPADGIPEHIVSCTVGAADPDCALEDVVGPAMPSATTILGTVNTQYPGGNTCTAAGAETNSTVMLLNP
ncbi:hypothetical protein [Pseudomonas wenzhouensis]|nr:hypothetical protein [Pseudomonas wenzhouensis]UFQ97622.1 hypothetical protein J7655_20585 [Pseudomonas wenzhouensis]